jgi:hypothetical protein
MVAKHFSRIVLIFALSCIVPAILTAQTCSLEVDQPPDTPTVIRTAGNTLIGRSALRVATHPAYGNWLLYHTTHVSFRPLGGGNFSEVGYSTASYTVPNGTTIGTTHDIATDAVYLQPRGDGEYRAGLAPIFDTTS